jgi:Transposase DNA-binding
MFFCSGDFKLAYFGDKRLRGRYVNILNSMISNVSTGVAKAFSNPSQLRNYQRFVNKPRVTFGDILNSFVNKSIGMINNAGLTRILAIQDTSNIYLDDQEVTFERGEIGYLDSSGRSRNGVKLHNTFGLDTEGNILGILDQKIWSRDFKSLGKTKDRAKLPIQDKEIEISMERFSPCNAGL